MVTKEILTRKQSELHDKMSEDFYNKKHSIGVTQQEQADFDKKHLIITQKYEADLIANGYAEPRIEHERQLTDDEIRNIREKIL